MDVNKYQIEVLKTWNTSEEKNNQLANCALGLSEFGELQQLAFNTHNPKIAEELGDFCYYIAMLCNLLNLNFAILVKHYLNLNEQILDEIHNTYEYADTAIFAIQNIIKKVRFHYKLLDEIYIKDITFALIRLIHYIFTMTDFLHVKLEDILKANIEKLALRHNRKGEEHSFIPATN